MISFQRLFALFARVLQALFGRWQPPAWLKEFLRRPRLLMAIAIAAIAAYTLGPKLYEWLTRPDPDAPPVATITTQLPPAIDFLREQPVPTPLVVEFSLPVAKLEHVGQQVTEVSIEPSVAGKWAWASDSSLSFAPTELWKPGTTYDIRFKATMFKPEAVLERLRTSFSTEPFTVSLGAQEFYQNPLDPNDKKAVMQFRFSHPVDRESFSQRVSLTASDGEGKSLPKIGYSIVFSDYDLVAFVHSEALTLPRNGGMLAVKVDAGVHAKLGSASLGEEQTQSLALPALYSLMVNELTGDIADPDSEKPKQFFSLRLSHPVDAKEVQKGLSAYLLPEFHPDPKFQTDGRPYPWQTQEVSEAILKQSEKLPLELLVAEQEVQELHQIAYVAPPARRIYVLMKKDLRSFGGFLMGTDYQATFDSKEYPQILKLAGEGALLSMKGERRVTVLARNQDGFTLEIARVKPDQLQHLVEEGQGSFVRPEMWDLSFDQLSERFEKYVELDKQDRFSMQYRGVDLGEFLSPEKRGVFVVSLYPGQLDLSGARNSAEHTPSAYESQSECAEDEYCEGYGGDYYDSGYLPDPIDRRLVVLTDLGLLSKRTYAGERAVYVQDLQTGEPAFGTRVKVLAVNGEAIAEASVDADGVAQLPGIAHFTRERRPVLMLAERGGDLSFLPLYKSNLGIDFSRFDTGGARNPASVNELEAFLFSDRGLYRPGERIQIGAIVRAFGWQAPLAGVPVRISLSDPRGEVLRSELINLDGAGFVEFSHQLSESAPTGGYRINLSLDNEKVVIGSESVQVMDFMPDRLKAKLSLNQNAKAWVSPDNLKALVQVDNLFGTPAQNRRVTATINLMPSGFSFAEYPNFNFYDPDRAQRSFSESLPDAETDAAGLAEIAIDLSAFDRATYQLELMIEAFEADGGRGVSAVQNVLVSSRPYLIGIKSVDDLNYIKKSDKRALELVAVDADLKTIAPTGLKLVLNKRNYVSVLTRQDSGLYKYQSTQRNVRVREQALELKGGRASIKLDTSEPGEYWIDIEAQDGTMLNRRYYTVVGEANVARSLERNAELKVSLKAGDVKAGEELELALVAPYTGAGLITLERDRVFAHHWFKTNETSSVQRIRVPEDFVGTGYVTVQFLRDINSPEIYMSPLSYAAVPFTAGMEQRAVELTLQTPKEVKPGKTARFQLKSPQAVHAVVYAVDEGILNVANYKLPKPLEYFYRKRRLDVISSQILSLLLPEFSRLSSAAAGGDDESSLAGQLNPFKRKRDEPAVYWSGITKVDGQHTFEFEVPETFNGNLKVMAVAVSDQGISSLEQQTLVRDEFVLSANVPMTVAPGDEFDVGVSIANQNKQHNALSVALEAQSQLEIVGEHTRSLKVVFGSEDSVRFRVRAKEAVGAQALTFNVSAGPHVVSRRVELSVRPLSLYRATVSSGMVRSRDRADVGGLREMWDAYAKRDALFANTPLVFVASLTATLDAFEHACSEQLISRAYPYLLWQAHPEWRKPVGGDPQTANARWQELLAVMSARQNSEGGVGLWYATPVADDYVSAYLGLLLVEARERQLPVPSELDSKLKQYLKQIAANPKNATIEALRTRALAAYVLTRSGENTTSQLSEIMARLQADFSKTYSLDSAAALVAASLKLAKQDEAAEQWIRGSRALIQTGGKDLRQDYWYYDNPSIRMATIAYLMIKHFPNQQSDQQAKLLDRLVEPVAQGLSNTLSSAWTLLALDAYTRAHSVPDSLKIMRAVQGKFVEIGEAEGSLLLARFDSATPNLRFDNGSDARAWYAVQQSGFDRAYPKADKREGIELTRELIDASGAPISSVELGQEVFLRVRLRAVQADVYSIAMVDLLPGGFEMVIPRATNEAPTTARFATGPGHDMTPDFVDAREDRMLIYAMASSQAKTFSYAIKANQTGKFQLAPGQAISMYDPRIEAVALPKTRYIEVVSPPKPQ
jgi:hypothetical protein